MNELDELYNNAINNGELTDEEELNIGKLLEALDNDANDSIGKLSSNKILQQKLDVLHDLGISAEAQRDILIKLQEYRHVDEMPDFRYGAFIRWINLNKMDDIKLTNGSMICDVLLEKTGIQIRCKNSFNRFCQLKLDECIVFQKLSEQERILLIALDHLENK